MGFSVNGIQCPVGDGCLRGLNYALLFMRLRHLTVSMTGHDETLEAWEVETLHRSQAVVAPNTPRVRLRIMGYPTAAFLSQFLN